MKSGPVGAGAGAELVTKLPGPSISNLMAKRSLRGPIALLFLIAVATVVSCRNAVRRSLSLSLADDQEAGGTHLRVLPSYTAAVGARAPPTPWNATLARMAAVDPYESEARRQVEDLLDVAGDGHGREFTHRSIASWRRWHRLERRKGGTVKDGGGERDAAGRLQRQASLPAVPEFRRALRDWSRRRWRFQPSVMSELVSLVKDPIDRHRGVSSGGRKKYASCAVVGNSGILLQREHGALIDSHEFVIRLNNARIAGYAAHVGTKTGLSFVNSNILHLCARRRTCSCQPYGADVPMAMYICQPIHFLDYALCNGSSPSSESRLILVTDPRFDELCRMIVKYYSLKRFVEETGKPPEEWGKAKDPKMFHYSSGMEAVLLAAGVCDKVSLFGFGKAEGAKHHYHTNQKKELDLHDYEAEYAFYRDLATAPHVIPFLAESGFKLPPVVVYN